MKSFNFDPYIIFNLKGFQDLYFYLKFNVDFSLNDSVNFKKAGVKKS